MRLDFNVLWVDDQPKHVKAQIDRISKEMEDEGFEFRPTQVTSPEKVPELVASDVFNDQVDLILVDWDLGSGKHGQDVIAQLRESIRYKDVVFYSALKTPEELRKLAYDARLEGVYCATRGDLVDEVVGVFESLVKKVLDLDHTRGIVMGATSDIDYTVNECLTSIHESLDVAGKEEMLREVHRLIDERVKGFNKDAEKLRGTTTIAAVFKAHMIFTANDRLRTLRHMLDTKHLEPHSGAKPSVTTYMNEVVPKRNKLGHQLLVPEGKPRVVRDEEGNQISLEEMRDLRRLILNLRSDFRNLLAALRAPS